MNTNVSLESFLAKEDKALVAAELRELILNSLSKEAYDDSPIDNEWVTQVEQQAPGIITAFCGNHNFLTSTPDENKRVVMEALNTGKALKAGVFAAIAMLIYKIYKVLTTNDDFSKGNRGTTVVLKQKTEALTTTYKDTENAINKAREVAKVAVNDKVINDEDSSTFLAAQKLANSLGASEEWLKKPIEYIKQYKELASETIDKTIGSMPSFMAEKYDTPYIDSLFNAHLHCAEFIDGRGLDGRDMSVLLTVFKDYVPRVKHLIESDPDDTAVNNFQQHFDTIKKAEEVLLKGLNYHFSDMIDVSSGDLRAMTGELNRRMQEYDHLIKPISVTGYSLGELTPTRMNYYSKTLGGFNQEIKKALSHDPNVFEELPERSQEREELIELQRKARSLNISDENIRRVIKAIDTLDSIADLYIVIMVYRVSVLRRATDAAEKNIVKLTDKLVDDIKKIENFISTYEKEEGI